MASGQTPKPYKPHVTLPDPMIMIGNQGPRVVKPIAATHLEGNPCTGYLKLKFSSLGFLFAIFEQQVSLERGSGGAGSIHNDNAKEGVRQRSLRTTNLETSCRTIMFTMKILVTGRTDKSL